MFDLTEEVSEAAPGYLLDYISGTQVKATDEEVDAVQVLARRLVEDYGYDKNQIQTRPQFRVRRSPSDEDRSYPVDIAVFRSSTKDEEQLYLIAECKKKNRKDGLTQLKLYMDMSPAEVGVWFNGDDHVYLHKHYLGSGKVKYRELPAMPRNGQRIEDIGLYLRKDLRLPSNLKAVFRDIRNHLAGNTTGITRDETLAQEIINLLFCKIYDELNTNLDDVVTFRSGVEEREEDVRDRLAELFNLKVKTEYPDVFNSNDSIKLDPQSIVYVVGELQNYCITSANRDAIGEAFEVFIGPALRGGEGQFFTPRNVVKMIIDILDPKPGEMVIDPACGSGGFLVMALEHVWKRMEQDAHKKGWNESQLESQKRSIAQKCFRGIDKDSFLAKVTKAYMAIIGDGRGGVHCENSLLPAEDWSYEAYHSAPLGTFDVVMTNPPFGTKIKIKGSTVLRQYALGHRWVKNSKTGEVKQIDKVLDEEPPQILFLERCLQLLKPNGRLGIVIPESILGNPSYAHVIAYIQANTTIKGIITMPESLFKTSGKGGTHAKVCVMILEKHVTATPHTIFMSEVQWCGHDSRGNPTIRKADDGTLKLLDEVPDVAPLYHSYQRAGKRKSSRLGFGLNSDRVKNRVLVPKYYEPEIGQRLRELGNTHVLQSIQDLIDQRAVSITTGIEIGKMAYGTGRIPFIRTSDLSNGEIKADFKHGISQDIYDRLSRSVDVMPGDIFMVRDGTYLIGTVAVVTEYDLPMLFQSHIYRIRVLKPSVINPWLLFACLNTPVVRQQIRSKQFTQDIIDTLGGRVTEIVLPIPMNEVRCKEIADQMERVIKTRIVLRNEATRLAASLELAIPVEEGEEENRTPESEEGFIKLVRHAMITRQIAMAAEEHEEYVTGEFGFDIEHESTESEGVQSMSAQNHTKTEETATQQIRDLLKNGNASPEFQNFATGMKSALSAPAPRKETDKEN